MKKAGKKASNEKPEEASSSQLPAPSADSEGEFHEPSEEAMACLRLELYRPVFMGEETATRAWKELREVRRQIGRSVQQGIGDIIVHVRNLRAAGKWRFATPGERLNAKNGASLPVECYEQEDVYAFGNLFNQALRASGLSEYVYSSVARRISNAELKGEKLRGILSGESAYPVMRNLGIMMRGRNWSIHTESRISGGKEYLEVYIEMSALRPGGGKMRLYCKRLHGPKLRRTKNLIDQLSTLGTKTELAGWSKGAMTVMPVRRPGQPEKWAILLPYGSGREPGAGSLEGPVLAVHRGVVNMLTAASTNGQTFQFPGRDIVSLKFQMLRRRKAIARDLAAMPHRGRGSKAHYKALGRLADAERRATVTNLWRAAKWVQGLAEKLGARLVLLDDFTSFDPDRPGPPWEPYVRTFPFAELKLKCIDALTRRAGIPVQEIKSRYISQMCPECGHVSESNVAKMPVVRGLDTEKGIFRCGMCRYGDDIDVVAAKNELGLHGLGPRAGHKGRRAEG